MTQRISLAAALTLAALTAAPAASQASDCRELDRVGAAIVEGADRVAKGVVRAGDHIVRAGDRTMHWIWCDKRRG
jgi:hypothetical protein